MEGPHPFYQRALPLRRLGVGREDPVGAKWGSANVTGDSFSRRKQEVLAGVWHLHILNPQKPLIILTRLNLSLKEMF